MKRMRIFGCLFILTIIMHSTLLHVSSSTLNPLCEDCNVNKSEFHETPIFYPLSTENVSIFNHKMEMFIRTDSTIKVESTLVIENYNPEPLEYFAFCINKTISSVFVEDPIGDLLFNWIPLTDSSVINVTMRYPLIQTLKYVITISYELYNLIYTLDKIHFFDFSILHTQETMDFQLLVYLPVNHSLIEGTNPFPFRPESAKVYQQYNTLVVEWEVEDVSLGFEYIYYIRYEEIIFESSYEPEPNTNLIYLYATLAFIIGVLLSSLIFFLIVKRKYQPASKKLVSTLLSDSEQAVIKAINDEGGVAIQRRICERTGYSKSKVSQILLKLEEKDVLKRERWGRTNRVTITNDSFLNIQLEGSSEETPES
ncbi:MAG: winged helix DNA-binding protein [Asgard group archaeon]|nr:winged helix DNA-binding protein [Asgard group archaeon]